MEVSQECIPWITLEHMASFLNKGRENRSNWNTERFLPSHAAELQKGEQDRAHWKAVRKDPGVIHKQTEEIPQA